MSKKVPSYKDIAERANVSQMTVSLAMRNQPSVSRATKERIYRIAEEIGYRPDPKMSQMMNYLRKRRDKKGTAVLALLNPNENPAFIHRSPFARTIVKGAEARADELGFQIQEFWLKAPGLQEERISSILEWRGIKGILLMPFLYNVDSLNINWEAFTSVATSYTVTSFGVNIVCKNSHHAFETAFCHLKERGYRRVGLAITHNLDERSNHSQLALFLYHQYLRPKKERMNPLVEAEIGPEMLHAWIKREKPDCVISPINEVHGWIREAGYQVPGDIGFASLSAQARDYAYTGIDQRGDRIGRAAVDLLTSQVNRNEHGTPEVRKQILIEGSWVEGETA